MTAVALAIWIVLQVAGCDCGGAAATDDGGPAADPFHGVAAVDPSGCAPHVHRLGNGVQRGVCYAHSWGAHGGRGYGTETSRRSRAELAALGVGWLSLTPFAFMRAVDSPEVRAIGDYPGGENDDVMAREIAADREEGFSILLKPHIWIEGGQYLGDIEMRSDEDWRAWLESYSEIVLHYAHMAAERAIPILAVGVELDHTTMRFEPAWRALIARVREVYDGELVYCANWDDVERVPIFDAVDYIGVQFYPPIASATDTSDATLGAELGRRFDALAHLSERTGKPILLTEAGYRSVHGATVAPHVWPEHDDGARVDEAEQARAYRALMNEIARRDFVRGVYLWKWFTDPDTDEEGPTGFSPRGKSAEAVVRAAYGGACPSPGG